VKKEHSPTSEQARQRRLEAEKTLRVVSQHTTEEKDGLDPSHTLMATSGEVDDPMEKTLAMGEEAENTIAESGAIFAHDIERAIAARMAEQDASLFDDIESEESVSLVQASVYSASTPLPVRHKNTPKPETATPLPRDVKPAVTCPPQNKVITPLPVGTPVTILDPLIGRYINHYKLIEKIGRGGYGAVYRALQTVLDEDVAIKILHQDYLVDDVVIKRFNREAKALARLNHSGVVRVLDFGLFEGIGFYLVMNYLEGENLSKLVGKKVSPSLQNGLPLERVKDIALQICDVLAYIHKEGILHRDLKPDNIFLDRRSGRERVQLIDFGIVTLEDDERLTKTGHYAGTMRYAAPEQFKDERDYDHRVDLYAFGIILHLMICGHEPFEKEKGISLMYAKMNQKVRTLSELAPERVWSPALEDLMQSIMAKEPEERPKDAAVLWDALGPALDEQARLDEENAFVL
tara:strand:+ start:7278 stop:8663 length:1386 start_codon:yes stop_codon:yes gene_type:complete